MIIPSKGSNFFPLNRIDENLEYYLFSVDISYVFYSKFKTLHKQSNTHKHTL